MLQIRVTSGNISASYILCGKRPSVTNCRFLADRRGATATTGVRGDSEYYQRAMIAESERYGAGAAFSMDGSTASGAVPGGP